MKMYSFLLGLLLTQVAISHSALLADDIHPEAKMGFVVVQAPKEGVEEFQRSQLFFSKAGSGSKRIEKLNEPYKVFAGEGCLRILSPGDAATPLGTIDLCGIQVREKQTIIIPLAVLELNWNIVPMFVDACPCPGLRLGSKSPQIKIENFQVEWSGLQRAHKSLKLVFAGNYQLDYGDEVAPLKGREISFSVGELEVKKLDATPSDVRSEIMVSTTPAKLPLIANHPSLTNYQINMLTLLQRRLSELPKDLIRNSVKENVMSRHSFPYATQTMLHAYALSPTQKEVQRHEIVVNNIISTLDLSPGRTTRVDLVSLNVYDLDGDKKGFFQVFQRDPVPGTPERRISWLYRLDETDVKPQPYDANYPKDNYTNYFTTGQTLLVPRGWRYKIASFAFDELNEFKPQSETEIDLR